VYATPMELVYFLLISCDGTLLLSVNGCLQCCYPYYVNQKTSIHCFSVQKNAILCLELQRSILLFVAHKIVLQFHVIVCGLTVATKASSMAGSLKLSSLDLG
jgi:hypothetical protein